MENYNNIVFDFIKSKIGETILYHAILSLVIFLFFVVSATILKIILMVIDKKFSISSNSKFRGTIYSIISKSIVPIFYIFGTYFAIDELIEGIARKYYLSKEILTTLHQIIFVLIIFLCVRISVRITKIIIEQALSKTAVKHGEKPDESKIISFNRLIAIIIYSIGGAIILKYFNQSITSILALLGVGSIAIGLAAQETISNMIAGFVIMFDRPFKVGNRIKLPTGEEGDIFEIGIRSTKILDFDNNLVIIPNAELIRSRIVNYSFPKESMRIATDFTVPFQTDIEKVKKICIEIMKEEKDLDKSISPEVLLMDLKGTGLHFRAICRVRNYKNYFKVGESIKIKIHDEFGKNKIDFIPMDKNIIIPLATKK